MTTTSVPHVQPVLDKETIEVVETATKIVRTKTFLKNTLKKAAVPTLLVVATAVIATRRANSLNENNETHDNTEE